MSEQAPAGETPKKKKLKIEPLLAMIGLILVGLALVWVRPPANPGVELRDDATLAKCRVGQRVFWLEAVPPVAPETNIYRVIADQQITEIVGDERLVELYGAGALNEVRGKGNPLFRIFNITGYASLIWIAIGLGGQIVFASRFLIQWIVSERRRESVIPEVFWWISLFGGISLFVYFIWRRDLVGVLGQSSGIVIYSRNIRLIYKQRRRELRKAERELERESEQDEDPQQPLPATQPDREPVASSTSG